MTIKEQRDMLLERARILIERIEARPYESFSLELKNLTQAVAIVRREKQGEQDADKNKS